jgi:hypothetical protein
MNTRAAIIVILVGVVLMSGGCGAIVWNVNTARENPQITNFEREIDSGQADLIEVSAIDGRYEFSLISVAPFDFMLLPVEPDIVAYKAGEEFGTGDKAQGVYQHKTFIQTGAGNTFALVVVNVSEQAIVVDIVQTIYPDPLGATGIMFVAAAVVGGFLILVTGLVLMAVARRKRRAMMANPQPR